VLFEEWEFRLLKCIFREFKHIFEGKKFSVNQKYRSKRGLYINVSVIILSNEWSYIREAFVRRLLMRQLIPPQDNVKIYGIDRI